MLNSKDNQIKVDQSSKARQMPSWLKRLPSEHDIQGRDAEDSENNKAVERAKMKKKPKLNI